MRKEGDFFKAYHFSLHHPLFLLDVQTAGEPIGKLIEASVSGLSLIEFYSLLGLLIGGFHPSKLQ